MHPTEHYPLDIAGTNLEFHPSLREQKLYSPILFIDHKQSVAHAVVVTVSDFDQKPHVLTAKHNVRPISNSLYQATVIDQQGNRAVLHFLDAGKDCVISREAIETTQTFPCVREAQISIGMQILIPRLKQTGSTLSPQKPIEAKIVGTYTDSKEDRQTYWLAKITSGNPSYGDSGSPIITNAQGENPTVIGVLRGTPRDADIARNPELKNTLIIGTIRTRSK